MTGSRSPSPATIGCSRLLTGVTTTVSGPFGSPGPAGWASRRSTASRCPTVSERGDSRSCGRVSQPGKNATLSGGRNEPSPAARSSASRAVAVTASTNPGAPGSGAPGSGAPGQPPRASAAASTGRSAGGATRSVPAGPVLAESGPVPARASTPRSCGSSSRMLSSPARLMMSL